MKNFLLISTLSLLSLAGAAQAGSSKMQNADGFIIEIRCQNSGCTVRGKEPGAKRWGIVERTAGGTRNYNALVEKYQGKGFN